MPNTFLNTGRVVSATSNPTANVEQVTPNNIQQPVSNNVNTAQPIQTQQNNSAVNPITIPIQIQPQVATPGIQQSNAQPIQPVQELQRTNDNQAPTPQVYQNNGANSNIVDFNQIYSGYQSMYGNGNKSSNTYSSGIKKTSLGTTIVTPTTSNLNSVIGQYQSAYADTVNGVISTIFERLDSLQNGTFYDPTQDTALRMASEYAANRTLQSLAGSGVLNSSATAERVARVVSELIPQYEKMAFERQVTCLTQLANTAQLVMQFDSQQFSYWKDAKDREFKNKEFEYQKQQDAINNAWKRVDELGFVDNNASTILGVKVGTLSGAAREAKEQREYELARMREQAQIEYQNNIALAKIRSELDLENSKQLAQYQSNLSRSDKEYEYKLAQKYGTTSSKKSVSDLSTYKEIMKNRFTDYDDVTKKYSVTPETNESAYKYLEGEVNSRRLSMEDAQYLIALYGVRDPEMLKQLENSTKEYAAKTIWNSARSILGGKK